jgi:hypothetical protein
LSGWAFGFEVGIPLFCVAYSLTATSYVFPSLTRRIVFGIASAAVTFFASYEVLNLLHISIAPAVHL